MRQYGVHGGLFTFESGRKGPEGPQKYIFKCTRAQQLFEQVRAGATQNRELGFVIPTTPAPVPTAPSGPPPMSDRRIEPPTAEAVPQNVNSTPNSPNEIAPSYVNVEIPPSLPRRPEPPPAAAPPVRPPPPEETPVASATTLEYFFDTTEPELMQTMDPEEDLDHPEINYLELDHTDEPREPRERPRETNNNEESGEQSYAEIDITSTQALTDLRANEDSHQPGPGPGHGQMRHDTTLDSIHSSASMSFRSPSTCTAILGFGANGKL